MTIITLIKAAFKGLKTIKKPTIWGLILNFTSIFLAGLLKHYPKLQSVSKAYKIFKVWTIGSIIISFLYGVGAEIFNFTYDYRFLVVFIYGLGVLFKEFIYEYYFDVHSWFKSFLEKVANRLNSKIANTQNPIINRKNIDDYSSKIGKRPETFNNDYSNWRTVRSDMDHSQPIKVYYTNNEDESLFNWKFYAISFVVSVVVAGYCVGVHYNYFPEPSLGGSWDYVKTSSTDIFNSIKDWFTGKGGGGAGGASNALTAQNTVGDETPKPNARVLDDIQKQCQKIFGHERVKSIPELKGSIIDASSSSSSSSTGSNPIQGANLLSIFQGLSNIGLDINNYPIKWNPLMEDASRVTLFNEYKSYAIGSFLYYLLEVQELCIKLGDYKAILNPNDLAIMDTLGKNFVRNIIELCSYSTTQFTDLNSLIDACLIVANIENIEPVVDMVLKQQVDQIISNYPHLECSIIFTIINKYNILFRLFMKSHWIFRMFNAQSCFNNIMTALFRNQFKRLYGNKTRIIRWQPNLYYKNLMGDYNNYIKHNCVKYKKLEFKWLPDKFYQDHRCLDFYDFKDIVLSKILFCVRIQFKLDNGYKIYAGELNTYNNLRFQLDEDIWILYDCTDFIVLDESKKLLECIFFRIALNEINIRINKTL